MINGEWWIVNGYRKTGLHLQPRRVLTPLGRENGKAMETRESVELVRVILRTNALQKAFQDVPSTHDIDIDGQCPERAVSDLSSIDFDQIFAGTDDHIDCGAFGDPIL